jgi:hypothetical protein
MDLAVDLNRNLDPCRRLAEIKSKILADVSFFTKNAKHFSFCFFGCVVCTNGRIALLLWLRYPFVSLDFLL